MESRKKLKPEQELPNSFGWQGLFAGPSSQKFIIHGDPLSSVDDKKIIGQSPLFVAPSGGQRGVKGDHPSFLGDPDGESNNFKM